MGLVAYIEPFFSTNVLEDPTSSFLLLLVRHLLLESMHLLLVAMHLLLLVFNMPVPYAGLLGLHMSCCGPPRLARRNRPLAATRWVVTAASQVALWLKQEGLRFPFKLTPSNFHKIWDGCTTQNTCHTSYHISQILSSSH